MVQRQLPFDVDVTQMQQQIDVEETRDALKQGIYAYVQSIGLLAQQGMDPSEILARVAEIIRDRQKGDQLEDIVVRAFAPKAPPPELEAAPGEAGATEPGMGGEGMSGTGLPVGTAPGQAGLGPGGRPDLQMLLAGLRGSGKPELSASVSRRVPA